MPLAPQIRLKLNCEFIQHLEVNVGSTHLIFLFLKLTFIFFKMNAFRVTVSGGNGHDMAAFSNFTLLPEHLFSFFSLVFNRASILRLLISASAPWVYANGINDNANSIFPKIERAVKAIDGDREPLMK